MKTFLIDAIVGIGFPSTLLASECERAGLAVFTGEPYAPEWDWRREQLEKCEETQLQELYMGLREERDSQQSALDATAEETKNSGSILCQ